jgi:hypothetical protein
MNDRNIHFIGQKLLIVGLEGKQILCEALFYGMGGHNANCEQVEVLEHDQKKAAVVLAAKEGDLAQLQQELDSCHADIKHKDTFAAEQVFPLLSQVCSAM